MFKAMFSIYRASPFFLRNAIGRIARLIGLILRPMTVIKVSDYRMALDFTDNASFKYAADRDKYEVDEVQAFLRAIEASRDCVVLDLGANYGAYTLAAASLATRKGGVAKIIAIEPDRRPYRALTRSVAIDQFESVCQVAQVIAAESEGEETIWINARSSADNRTHSITTSKIRVRESYRVRAATVDTLLAEMGAPTAGPLVIKMDIQGNEPRAFYGMEKALGDASSWYILFEHAPYLIESAGIDLEAFVNWVAALGVEISYEYTRDGGFTQLTDVGELTRSMRNIAIDPSYKGEAPATNFVITRGIDKAVLASIVGHG